jgi:hypothetical protein
MPKNLARDSALIEIHESDGGFVLRMWKWKVSPPPIPYRDLDHTLPEWDTQESQVAKDLNDVITKLTVFISKLEVKG